MTVSLVHFIPLVSFFTPWKPKKARFFDVFQVVLKETNGIKWATKNLFTYSSGYLHPWRRSLSKQNDSYFNSITPNLLCSDMETQKI